MVGKLSSQEGVFPFCLNNVYRGYNDGIPTAPGTTAVALWGADTNARGLFGFGKLKCTILARCHRLLPMSAAHEYIKTMTCPISPSKGFPLINSGSHFSGLKFEVRLSFGSTSLKQALQVYKASFGERFKSHILLMP